MPLLLPAESSELVGLVLVLVDPGEEPRVLLARAVQLLFQFSDSPLDLRVVHLLLEEHVVSCQHVLVRLVKDVHRGVQRVSVHRLEHGVQVAALRQARQVRVGHHHLLVFLNW